MNRMEIISVAAESYRTSEAFKSLRTNIQFSGTDIKCILVTSCMQDEGKSFISIELAKSLSEIGKKVIVVDADMRNSEAIKRYKIESQNPVGLSQYLTNQASFENVLFKTQYENLHIVLSGIFPPNPVELLCTEKFKEFLVKCRQEYDYVIVDTPPLGVVIDAAVIAQNCDGAVLVIAAEKIKYRLALSVKKQLAKSNCKIIGAIMNYTDSKGFIKKKYEYGNYRHHSGDGRGSVFSIFRRKKPENTDNIKTEEDKV